MRELIDTFIEHLRIEQGVSGHTLRAYSGDLNDFFSFIDMKPAEVDYLDIRSFLASLHHKKLKKTSIARKLLKTDNPSLTRLIIVDNFGYV